MAMLQWIQTGRRAMKKPILGICIMPIKSLGLWGEANGGQYRVVGHGATLRRALPQEGKMWTAVRRWPGSIRGHAAIWRLGHHQ